MDTDSTQIQLADSGYECADSTDFISLTQSDEEREEVKWECKSQPKIDANVLKNEILVDGMQVYTAYTFCSS